MSLETIKAMRLAGQKPAGVLSVTVGERPRALTGAPDLIVIGEHQRPRDLDLRPLIGCWVALYDLNAAPARLLEAMEALRQAGVKLFGVASTGLGIHPMVQGADDRDVRVLRAELEALCRC